MAQRRGNRLTILRAMVLIAIVGIILGLFAADRDDPGMVTVLLLASLVVVVPVHFGIEGNRRDVLNIEAGRASHPDSRGPAGAV
jgi:hypothetical protein